MHDITIAERRNALSPVLTSIPRGESFEYQHVSISIDMPPSNLRSYLNAKFVRRWDMHLTRDLAFCYHLMP